MQCAHCGTENTSGGRFCGVCGAPVDGAAAPAEPASTAPSEPAVAAVETPFAAPVAPVAYAPAPAPVYAPAPAPTYAPPPPPRKKHGCLITSLVLLLVLGVACAAVVWFVTRPPRDLGVSYTEADYQSAVAKLGITVVDTVPDMPIEQTKIVYSGKKKIDVRLTSKEVSAVISMHHRSPKWALSDVQILLGDNNQAQLSGFAVYDGARYAFYADLNAVLAGPQAIGATADKIVVFGVDFPQQWYSVAEQYLVQKTNDWLAGMGDGLDIQSASIENGELVLVGTVPAEIRRVPLNSVNTSGTLGP
jgi:hypothetical protein